MTPCLPSLVQANARNKRLLFDGIDALVDRDIARADHALEFAFEQLENFDREKPEQEGSDCHKLIMMFSDGGTEYPASVVNRFRNATVGGAASKARIFTYAVGPHPVPTVALKKMACQVDKYEDTFAVLAFIKLKLCFPLFCLERR